MSHFSVMVIGNNVDDMLAPYQENNMGDCPEEYLEFFNVEEEYKESYETDTTYPESFVRRNLDIEKNDLERLKKEKNDVLVQNISYKGMRSDIEQEKTYPIEGVDFCVTILDIQNTRGDSSILALKKVEKPEQLKVKDQMSFIEYMETYCGYKFCSKNEAFGYYENPNAKWDWYAVGGRWSNFLKLKENDEYADCALVKDIDFDGMRKDAENDARKHFEAIEILMGGSIPSMEKTWEQCVKEYRNEDDSFNREEALAFYENQEAVIKYKEMINNTPNEQFEALGLSLLSMRFYGKIDDYQISKEEYINNAGNASITSFALIKDGKWYEKGEMGWFGMSTDKMSQQEWNTKVAELLKTLDDDTLITIVDCHI